MLDQQMVLFEKLRGVTADYAVWFQTLAARLSAQQVSMGDVVLTPPASWSEFNSLISQEGMPKELGAAIKAAQSDLHSTALTLAPKLMSGQAPDKTTLTHLMGKYLKLQEALIGFDREQTEILGEYDAVSFLRHVRYLEREWIREMERLTREGKVFCVCLAHLDTIPVEGYDSKKLTPTEISQIRYAGALITRCVRVFDDVFLMEDGSYFVLLKQTNQSGAMRFVKRLQKLVQESGLELNPPLDLTLSCCIAEPIVGESLHDIMKQMQNDMFDQRHAAQDVVARREISPLARFVESLPRKAEG